MRERSNKVNIYHNVKNGKAIIFSRVSSHFGLFPLRPPSHFGLLALRPKKVRPHYKDISAHLSAHSKRRFGLTIWQLHNLNFLCHLCPPITMVKYTHVIKRISNGFSFHTMYCETRYETRGLIAIWTYVSRVRTQLTKVKIAISVRGPTYRS